MRGCAILLSIERFWETWRAVMDFLKKKLPIGVDRFKKLREEDYYYIDKTGMIRDLIQSWGEVNLFTRDRKSTRLNSSHR